jgi:hypothetical protein
MVRASPALDEALRQLHSEAFAGCEIGLSPSFFEKKVANRPKASKYRAKMH